ncbi:MAG: hypothetical protein CMG80_05235 [Marinobacter sp.]|nr:hypothetical protein [Marinobacter sp.]
MEDLEVEVLITILLLTLHQLEEEVMVMILSLVLHKEMMVEEWRKLMYHMQEEVVEELVKQDLMLY